MTDKELLELAAKAAGIKICWPDRGFPVTNDFSYLVEGDFVGRLWNPLTDDGDALRLAVKLGFMPTVGMIIAENLDDPYAATRRTIVRAAAEIGKAMP